jgi:hypothetical protein
MASETKAQSGEGDFGALPTNIVPDALSMMDVVQPSKNIPGLSTGDVFYAHQ